MHLPRLFRVPACVLFVLLPAAVCAAGDPPQEQEAPPANSAPDVARWIKELDSDSFAVREKASKGLREAGASAVEALVEAAQGESLEVTTRAFELLSGFYASDDEALRVASRKALEKLERSSKQSVAGRARDILTPPAEAHPQPLPGLPNLPFGNMRIFGGGRNVSVTSRDNNGTREIDIREDETKVKIEDRPGGPIKVTVTETVDGKLKSTSYEAKDAKELKEKHAAAYDWYDRYAKGGGINVMFGNLFGQGNLFPLPIPNAGGGAIGGGGVPNRLPRQFIDSVQEEIDQARAEVEKARSALRQAAAEGGKVDAEELAKGLDTALEKLSLAAKKLTD
jgi:hypothetical protein